jgi:hypothetical protein
MSTRAAQLPLNEPRKQTGAQVAQPICMYGFSRLFAVASKSRCYATGPGHLNGSVVAPAEVDTPFATGQSIWWWAPQQTFKSLRELQIEYDNSVGHNANLLLGITPDWTGRLPEAHVQRYGEFGNWVRSCYGTANMLAQVRRCRPCDDVQRITAHFSIPVYFSFVRHR